MQRPLLKLPVVASTSAMLERDKAIVALQGVGMSAFADLHSVRVRQGQGWEGRVVLSHGDWVPGETFKTPIGKIFAIQDGGVVDIYQISLVPLGNPKPAGPPYELSPNRSTNVMAPFAAFLHGAFDTAGRMAGVLNLFLRGGPDSREFTASPDVTDYWAYGWTDAGEIAAMDSAAVFFDEQLRKNLAKALTHWFEWDTLPSDIRNGAKVLYNIEPEAVKEDEIVFPKD